MCLYFLLDLLQFSKHTTKMICNLACSVLENTMARSVMQKRSLLQRFNRKTRTISVSLLQGLVVLEVQHCPVYTCKHLEERDILLHLSAIMRRLFSHKLRVKTTSHPHPHLSYLKKKICFSTCRNNF